MATDKEAAAGAAADPTAASAARIPRFLGSCRFTVGLLLFGYIFHNFYLRYCFSTGIVCMVGTKINATEDQYAIQVYIYQRRIEKLLKETN